MIKTNLIEPINKILLKQAKVQNKKIAFSDFNSEINYYELETIHIQKFNKNYDT